MYGKDNKGEENERSRARKPREEAQVTKESKTACREEQSGRAADRGTVDSSQTLGGARNEDRRSFVGFAVGVAGWQGPEIQKGNLVLSRKTKRELERAV